MAVSPKSKTGVAKTGGAAAGGTSAPATTLDKDPSGETELPKKRGAASKESSASTSSTPKTATSKTAAPNASTRKSGKSTAAQRDEDSIRRRAYELWEQGGFQHGKHDEHWQQAEREAAGGNAYSPGGDADLEGPKDQVMNDPGTEGGIKKPSRSRKAK